MSTFQQQMTAFKALLEEGTLLKAYQGLMAYIGELKSHLQKKYPDYIVPSNTYYGYMDMTYFAFFPHSLKKHKLKVGIVFNYEKFRFEAALFGVNRDVQEKYWEWIRKKDLGKYILTPNPRKTDYIVLHVLVDTPDFGNLDALTEKIETGTLAFISDITELLSE